MVKYSTRSASNLGTATTLRFVSTPMSAGPETLPMTLRNAPFAMTWTDESAQLVTRMRPSRRTYTPSYWPERISVTISSEVLPILTLTWQPVSFSKSDTQSTFGSVEPSST